MVIRNNRHKDSGSVRKGVCESPQGKECKLVTHVVGWLLLRVEQERRRQGTWGSGLRVPHWCRSSYDVITAELRTALPSLRTDRSRRTYGDRSETAAKHILIMMDEHIRQCHIYN